MTFNRTKVILVYVFLLICLSACGDECTKYSDFNCEQIQEATYNAYFYYPNGSEVYLGIAEGLGQCGSMAHYFASSKALSGNRNWSYICCMKAKGSECYEKHR